jgi:hypothetical protein
MREGGGRWLADTEHLRGFCLCSGATSGVLRGGSTFLLEERHGSSVSQLTCIELAEVYVEDSDVCDEAPSTENTEEDDEEADDEIED